MTGPDFAGLKGFCMLLKIANNLSVRAYQAEESRIACRSDGIAKPVRNAHRESDETDRQLAQVLIKFELRTH